MHDDYSECLRKMLKSIIIFSVEKYTVVNTCSITERPADDYGDPDEKGKGWGQAIAKGEGLLYE
jgi:hypothetical protein